MERGVIQMKILQPEDISDELRSKLDSDSEHIIVHPDTIYLQIGQMIISFPNNQNGKELAYSFLNKKNGNNTRPGSAAEIYERLLFSQEDFQDRALIKKYRIREKGVWRIAVFRSIIPLDKDMYSILSSMAPVESGDIMIPADFQTAVLIKDAEGQSEEEISEFIEAVIGTLESEGVSDIRAGISCECTDIYKIRKGYADSLRALELGLRYHRQDHVYAYEKQILESIVDSIPDEQKRDILNSFFHTGAEAGLSDELLETVRVFFRNDLNLTAASRQLFIHRNTLNYRLDKIRKDFGLDLRSFQDAVIFRIVTEIAKVI